MPTIRELVVALRFDGDKAMTGLAKFGLAVNGVKAGLEIMAGAMNAARAATFGFVNDQTAAGDQIAKTARAMGVGAREFQRLAFAAEQSGVPMGNLIKASQNLARNMRDAALSGGKGGFATALTEVGLEMKDLIGLSFEDKLALIGEALQKLPTEAAKVAASQKLLGEEAGPKFASFLKLSSDEIRRLGDEAERLGIVMSDEALAAAEDYQGALTDLDSIVTGLKRSIGIGLAPQMKALVKQFTEWIKINNKMIRQKVNKMFDLIVEAMSGGLDKLEKWVESFIKLVGVMFDVIDGLIKMSDAVGGVENAIKLATVAWLTYRVAQAAALGPLAVAATAVLFLAAAFASVSEQANNAIDASSAFNDVDIEIETVSEKIKKQLGGELASLVSSNLKRRRSVDREGVIDLLASLSKSDLKNVFEREDVTTKFERGESSFLGIIDAETTERDSDLRRARIFREIESRRSEEKSRRRAKEDNRRQRVEAKRSERRSLRSAAERAEFDRLARLGATGGGAGGKSKAEQDSINEDEILKLISISARTGQSLTGLIGKRRIEGGTPPVISATFVTNTVQVDAPITIEGVPSDTAEEAAERFTEMIAEHLSEKIQEATEELAPVMAR